MSVEQWMAVFASAAALAAIMQGLFAWRLWVISKGQKELMEVQKNIAQEQTEISDFSSDMAMGEILRKERSALNDQKMFTPHSNEDTLMIIGIKKADIDYCSDILSIKRSLHIDRSARRMLSSVDADRKELIESMLKNMKAQLERRHKEIVEQFTNIDD